MRSPKLPAANDSRRAYVPHVFRTPLFSPQAYLFLRLPVAQPNGSTAAADLRLASGAALVDALLAAPVAMLVLLYGARRINRFERQIFLTTVALQVQYYIVSMQSVIYRFNMLHSRPIDINMLLICSLVCRVLSIGESTGSSARSSSPPSRCRYNKTDMCMCVCVSIYIYIYIYIHMYVYDVYIYMCVSFLYIYIYIYIHMYLIYLCVYVHMYVSVYICI